MKHPILSFFSVFIILVSCNSAEKEILPANSFSGVWESTSNAGANAKAILVIDSSANNFVGYIEYSTLANSGSAYRKIGKSNLRGSIVESQLKLDLSDSQDRPIGKAQLTMVGDSLKYLTISEGVDFPAIYFKKKNAKTAQLELGESENSEHWNKLRNKGVLFIGTGNEPFWSVELNVNGRMSFNSLKNNNVVEVNLPEPAYSQDKSLVRYKTESTTGWIDLVMQKMPCSDNMSGNSFEYFVSAEISDKDGERVEIYEGCGKYLGDTRLNNKWVLTSVDNIEIALSESSELPFLEFNLDSGQASGNAGCNQFQTSFSFGNHVIEFENVAATKKLCQSMDIENQFLNMISGQLAMYSMSSGILLLEFKNGNLKFKKSS